MSEQRVVYYVDTTADGYIAADDGGVEWLSDFSGVGGYDEFFAGVGSLVLGRTTFDQVLGWRRPYGEKPAAILTSTLLPAGVPPAVYAGGGSEAAGLVARLRSEALAASGWSAAARRPASPSPRVSSRRSSSR